MGFAQDYPDLVGSPRFQEAYGEQVSKSEYGMDMREFGDDGLSKAIQSARDESDINNIVAQFHRTGFLPEVQKIQGLFEDVSEMPDYKTALERVDQVNEVFMQLPAHIRAEFKNDAAEFVDFMSDDANTARGIELGLIEDPNKPAVPVDEVPGPGVQGRDPVTGQFTSPK